MPSTAFIARGWLPLLLSLPMLFACADMSSLEDSAALPTCTEFRNIYRAALNRFDEMRSGPRMYSTYDRMAYYPSAMRLPRASSCKIWELERNRLQLECEWAYGTDNRAMGSQYRGLRDKLLGCVKDMDVHVDDAKGYVSMAAKLSSSNKVVLFSIHADYEQAPFGVRFNAEEAR